MKAVSASTATITGVHFTTPIGSCGPANLTVNPQRRRVSYNGPFRPMQQYPAHPDDHADGFHRSVIVT